MNRGMGNPVPPIAGTQGPEGIQDPIMSNTNKKILVRAFTSSVQNPEPALRGPAHEQRLDRRGVVRKHVVFWRKDILSQGKSLCQGENVFVK